MSRVNDDSRDLPASAGIVELLAALRGPADFWDRPEGDFGPLSALYGLDRDAWERANSLYLLGSKALGRGELAVAADWLGEAAAAGHPGAMFRMTAVTLRAGADWVDEARFLVAEAARHGHGDAARLLAGLAHRRPATEPGEPEDGQFFDEVREGLGVAEHLLHPDTGDTPQSATQLVGAVGAEGGEQPRLYLVRAPQVPEYGPTPDEPAGPAGGARHLAALPEGGRLVLPMPDLRPDATAAAVHLVRQAAAEADTSSGGPVEPWWSAHALRPAVLNDMARRRNTPAPVPAKWQTTQRARDLLHAISTAGGIDSRALAHKARLSLGATVRLLDWLLEQRLVETVGGAYFTGPMLDLVTKADPGRRMLGLALERLRDDLGAAVYISTYAHGEIEVNGCAYSATAPPVHEWAPFTETAHASAVGKSLLAQLDFDSRMNHLTRYPTEQLTERTITSPRDLIEVLDEPGPHAAQFDLLEYSEKEVCVAYSLGLPGRASSIALSLPAHDHSRLITAAQGLSQRATGLLLAHLLTDDNQAATATRRAAEQRRALP
ncbi:IclR family transcriptional regulator C-terminal domain-containing protein [Streptomyces sp. NPDC093225]|uniref:IclR family transcriptional regulator domain-containing protein n=1 Tax=Streptomyces sp. NPDC093225 TaxID=3366034 RepID=UPI0038298451